MKISKNIEKTLTQWDKEYKKGFTSYVILLFLKKQPMYGYEIKYSLENMTNMKITFQDSGIYQILKKLNLKKMVTTEIRESTKGPKRKYYSITDDGVELINLFTWNYVLPMNKALTKLIDENITE